MASDDTVDDTRGTTADGTADAPPPGTVPSSTAVPALGMTGASGTELAEQMARVVHELRSPLAATSQVIDLLERTADQPPDPSLLAIARRQIDSGLRRVGQLLVLLTSEADRAQLQPRPHRLAELVHEHLAPRRATEPEHDLRMEIDEDLTVLVDGAAFIHVLDNLVTNAVRHAPSGSAVLLAGKAVNDQARLRIVDAGPGMDAELRARAFDPFARGAGGGAGLGLTIVRHVVDAHGGEVWIEDAEPQGTCVVVSLPRAEDGDASADRG